MGRGPGGSSGGASAAPRAFPVPGRASQRAGSWPSRVTLWRMSFSITFLLSLRRALRLAASEASWAREAAGGSAS